MWMIIFTLLAIGLALMIVELVFIPGTTLVGLLGVIFMIFGIAVTYRHFGSDTGMYVLIGSSALSLALFVISFRTNAWKRFSLKTSNDGKVNEGMLLQYVVGEEGITTTTLRPVGKMNIHDQQLEVKAMGGGYIESGTRVRIFKIESNQIIVEPIN